MFTVIEKYNLYYVLYLNIAYTFMKLNLTNATH